MLKLVFYENQFTSVADGKFKEFAWDALVELLREPEVVTNKGTATQIFFGAMREEAQSKGDSDVQEVSCLVIDVDKIPFSDLALLEKVIEEEKWDAILHSTHRHHEWMQLDPPQARVRIILPLSRPVHPEEFLLLWSNANLTFEGFADGTTRNPSKAYLAPSVLPGQDARDSYIFKVFKGEPLDPDEMMSRFGTPVLAEAEIELYEIGSEPVTANMLKDLLQRKHSKEDKVFVDAIKRGLGRLSMAESGNRENTYFGVAGVFAKHFPRGNPDDICAALEYSIEYEAKQGGPSLKEFKDKLVRRQRDILKRSALKRMEVTKEQAKIAKIKATKEPYTPETLQPYFESCNNKINFEGLKNALVLVHRNNYYVFGEGSYHFATQNSLLATVREWLLYRAEALDFDYYYPRDGEKPPTPKSPDHFVRDHGRVIRHVRYTHRGVSWYDSTEQILWLSESKDCRRLLPARCVEFERWLRCMCGDDTLYDKICQWLSQVPNTRRALAGLVLAGPTGIGKSAFAEGVAKLWGTAPGTMQNAMSNHNSELVNSPVVFADESLPEVNGRVPTDKLRSLISSRHHEINPKGLPISQLDSFVRVIVALQNMSKFDFGRGHTKEDNVAIGRRFLFVEGQEEAAELFDYDLFVGDMGIAKHIMWLAQTRERTSSRFGVDTDGEDFVISADPYTMKVADWVVAYLAAKVFQSAEARPPNKRVSCFVNKGEIYVNSRVLRAEWEMYQSGRAKNYVPTALELTQALRAMSQDKDPVRIRMPAMQESYWRLRTGVIRKRAIETDELSDEQFDLLLQIPHEIEFRAVNFKLSDHEKQERAFALKKYKDIEGVA